MHLGHRRANSYSRSSTGGSTAAPEASQAYNTTSNDQSAPVLPPPPPPPILVSSQRQNPSSSVPFVRTTEERRSFSNHTERSSRISSRAYKGIHISRATPAAVKFSIYPPELDWFFEMNRPKSPVKTWRNGISSDVAGVPSLDQTLAAIKDQLAMLKNERAELSNRVDELSTSINKTQSYVDKKIQKYNRHQQLHNQRHQVSAQRSPGQPLRRIRSLEGRANSYTQLHTIVRDEFSDYEEDEEIEPYDSSSHTPVIKRQRKTSVPSKILRSVNNSLSNQTKTVEQFLLRKTSSHNRRSLQALETIQDSSPTMYRMEIGSSNSGDFSPDSTPESSPKLVRVSSVHSVNNKPYAKVLVGKPLRSSSQTLYGKNGFSTLPSRKKSSSTSSCIYDDTLSDSTSIPDITWDECSLQSEGSLVFRISSATGQVEKVLHSSGSPHGKRLSFEKLNSPMEQPVQMRKHPLHCSIGREESDDSNLIMNLTEEPRPMSLCFEPPQREPICTIPKRNSFVLLHGIETTV